MGLAEHLSHAALQPELWVIAALILIIADLIFGLALFVLSIGVAALIIAGFLFAQAQGWVGETVFIETARGAGTWFAGLSVAAVTGLKLGFRQTRRQPDINQY